MRTARCPQSGIQELGEVRRSQVITTYGPGSIVDFRVGKALISAVAAGLDAWDNYADQDGRTGINHSQTIKEPRLQTILGVDGFRLPPAVPKDKHNLYENRQRLAGVCFPSWLHCPNCKKLQHADSWGLDPGGLAPHCGEVLVHGSSQSGQSLRGACPIYHGLPEGAS